MSAGVEITAIGVIYGLTAAVAQSLSYLFSRLFVIRRHTAVFHLLVLAHLAMGAASLLLGPALLLTGYTLPPLERFASPLIFASLFYLLGQLGLFIALRYTDASRTAPLLGLKIPLLAMIATLYFRESLSTTQWTAVAASVAAAFMLNYAGKAMRWQALVAVLGSCLAYSISDINIRLLVTAMGGMSIWQAPFMAVSVSYAVCGVFALAFAPWAGLGNRADWKYALPFSAAWYGAMIFLFMCFGSVGVVYGNILQSTRGLVSVIMGAHLAAMGLTHLEKRVPLVALLQRVAAALLMTAAIALYVWKN